VAQVVLVVEVVVLVLEDVELPVKVMMVALETEVEHLLVVEEVVEQTQLEAQLDHAHLQEEKVELELQIQSQDLL
tara:strand:- start:156 stop:380 length:225 start_codon:yes stop_codon:yes gene_type:complete